MMSFDLIFQNIGEGFIRKFFKKCEGSQPQVGEDVEESHGDRGEDQELIDIRDKPEMYLVCLTPNPQAVSRIT